MKGKPKGDLGKCSLRKPGHAKLNSVLTLMSSSIPMASTVISKRTLSANCRLDTDTWLSNRLPRVPKSLTKWICFSLLFLLNILLLLSSLPRLPPISQAQSCPVYFDASLSFVNHSQLVTKFCWFDLLPIFSHLFRDLHPHSTALDQPIHLSLDHCRGLPTGFSTLGFPLFHFIFSKGSNQWLMDEGDKGPAPLSQLRMTLTAILIPEPPHVLNESSLRPHSAQALYCLLPKERSWFHEYSLICSWYANPHLKLFPRKSNLWHWAEWV